MTAGVVFRGVVLGGVVAAGLVMAGCGQPDEDRADGSDTSREPGSAGGTMVVSYDEATTPEAANGRKILHDNELLEELAAAINDTLILPHDVTLRGAECGEPNAYWNSDENTVTLCYEDADAAFRTFTDDGEADPTTATLNAETATFYHEVGHMVISLYDLPVTGREEDAADQLAAYVLLEPGADGRPDEESVQAVKDFARTFQAVADERDELDVEDLADEHSLDETRVYNLQCWIYGADPAHNQDLVGEDGLPPSRADGCGEEWRRVEKAWSTLLEPHLKR